MAGVCVAVIHGSIAYLALYWPRAAAAAVELPAAVMIEMAALPVAPDTPAEDVAPGPQMEMSQAATPSVEQETPVEPEQTDVEAEPESTIEMPPLPEHRSADPVPTASARPQQDKPTEMVRKPERPKPERPRPARTRPQDRAAQNGPATTAPQAAPVQRASTNAAPVAGTSSSVSPASWRSLIMALLHRHKRFPAGGSRGTATVAFTIDRAGRVLSARLARSSGDAALDQEVVALARRVSPVPPPPADLGGAGPILLAVPVRFDD